MKRILFAGLVFSALFSARGDAPNERQMAAQAIQDMVGHYWVGEPESGEILTTWGGYHKLPLPDARGGLWERGMFYFALENYYLATKDAATGQRLRAEWSRTKKAYTDEEAVQVGERSKTNWACDDAGWCAMYYLAAYRTTQDPAALERAKGIVKNAYERWMDDQLGGGMWYADAGHKVAGTVHEREKSLYQAGIVYASLRIYAITHEQYFLDQALLCYKWMESHLRRPDNLYWCGCNAAGPIGANRPKDIQEAGSVSFLGGNMGMGVLHALLFRLTGDDQYRQRAIRTAHALRSGLLAKNGVFINDRDAWSNGTFAGEWAREVLTLPGISPADKEIVRKTAASIFTKARTEEGYYGGSWSGPADGEESRWYKVGSKPQQIMTSASSVLMIMSALLVADVVPNTKTAQ